MLRSTLIILICIVATISCKKEKPAKKITTEFDYLLGDWERTNSKGGNETFEHWKIVSATEIRGHGYTIEDEDTIFNERMHIIKNKEQWLLTINGPNEDPTIFKITANDNRSFTAINPENEFPKEIKYSYFDDVLTAIISSEETEIPFIFWRIEN